MGDLPFRRLGDAQPSGKPTSHRCSQCGANLSLARRRVTPPRLGPETIVEFYMCGVCDAGYALNVNTGIWTPWLGEDK